jgi:hypothetical protein
LKGKGNDFTRVMTQVDRVAAITGKTLSLERPLYLTFLASQSPAINYMTPTYGIGVESLQLYRTGKGIGGYNISMGTVAESHTTDITYKRDAQSTAYVEGNFSIKFGTATWASGPR